MTRRAEVGEVLVFTRDLDGVCRVNAGDRARYLGGSQARILTGPSAGWLVWLSVGAPVELEVTP